MQIASDATQTRPVDDTLQVDRQAPRSLRPRMTGRQFLRLSGAYVGSRALVVGAAQVSVWITNRGGIVSALASWDSGHYRKIAVEGYGGRTANGFSVRYAFFPAWPVLLRAINWVLGGSVANEGIVLAFLLSFGAAIAIWLAVATVLDAETAERTAVLFMFLPASFVLSMVYSEPLFIAVAALCLYALQRQWWVIAGLSAAIAGATRTPGVVLVLCCLVAAISEIRTSHRWWPAIVAPLLAPTGLLLWMYFQWYRVGNPLAFVKGQRRGWGNGNSWGLSTLRAVGRLVASGHRFATPWPLLVTLSTILFLTGVVLVIVNYRKLPAAWLAYTCGAAAFAWSVNDVWSLPRLLLPVFPALALLVQRLPHRVYRVLLAVSAGVMVLSALLFFNPTKWTFNGAP